MTRYEIQIYRDFGRKNWTYLITLYWAGMKDWSCKRHRMYALSPTLLYKDLPKKNLGCSDDFSSRGRLDPILALVIRSFGGCKSMDSYGFRKDADGNPLVEDCQKQEFALFYSSPEAITLFDALWKNKNGT